MADVISIARKLDPIDRKSFCQLQLQQFIQQLPTQLIQQISALATWLTYWNPLTNHRQSVQYKLPTVADADQVAFLNYLSSEDWWFPALPTLNLSKLLLPSEEHVYICPIQQQETGAEYWLLWVAEPLTPSQQHSVELHAQLMAHSLNLYRECCRQQSKVELLEQVIQKADHQLRNPLALMGLYSTTLEMSLPEGDLRSQASLIREATEEISLCLKEVSSCGQQARLRAEHYDLRTILADAIHHLHPWLAEKHLQIAQSSESVLLYGDFWQLKQVLINLISNAVHFSPVRGTITCQWQVFRHEVLIEVRDQGPGLSEIDLSQIFTPFYSRRPGGTGLGLSISQKIILDHQGRIWAQNLPGGGAGFSFALPRRIEAGIAQSSELPL
ncbi:hypothetical protein BST81_19560 [Leptolyngbya sp. 'hensonii']|nr:hypothetical protein BST81_19560 [Leptolyngbya sp. 'hensonii']